jgi:hypothetical protein
MKTDVPLSEPQTLIEAIRYFADLDVALRTLVELRWPAGVHCPTCGRTDVRFIATRRMWECKEKHARKQFSAKAGTIFEDSPIDLGKWFAAIWMVANCKNGISSYEMHRALGVTQKTAWFIDHRIRLAMKTGSFLKLSGEIEADETFIGGLAKNMHESKKKHIGTGGAGAESPATPDFDAEDTPMERFNSLTRKLLRVPRRELEQERSRHEARKGKKPSPD